MGTELKWRLWWSHAQASAARACYYPGSKAKWADIVQRYPGAQLLGVFPPGCDTDDAMPWALIRDVTPGPTEYILRNEPWCGVLAEVVLDGADHPVEFMRQVCVSVLACVVHIEGHTKHTLA
jgi:hypothetical protein